MRPLKGKKKGLFVGNINRPEMAERYGFRKYDKILSVNGKNLGGLPNDDAHLEVTKALSQPKRAEFTLGRFPEDPSLR